ncbi:hypothetical protein KC992_04005 [Candidatus Saccharibacteria bacterium]|nr:hypothetical protein [Candidatus Saccharibacteria bacterium]
MREFLQADIDDRVIPPKVEVVCVIKPPDGGEIVSPATMEQIGYLAACAATDLGDNHPGIAELRTYVAEQAL